MALFRIMLFILPFITCLFPLIDALKYEGRGDLPACAQNCIVFTAEHSACNPPADDTSCYCPSQSWKEKVKTCLDAEGLVQGCAKTVQADRIEDVMSYINGIFCPSFNGSMKWEDSLGQDVSSDSEAFLISSTVTVTVRPTDDTSTSTSTSTSESSSTSTSTDSDDEDDGSATTNTTSTETNTKWFSATEFSSSVSSSSSSSSSSDSTVPSKSSSSSNTDDSSTSTSTVSSSISSSSTTTTETTSRPSPFDIAHTVVVVTASTTMPHPNAITHEPGFVQDSSTLGAPAAANVASMDSQFLEPGARVRMSSMLALAVVLVAGIVMLN